MRKFLITAIIIISFIAVAYIFFLYKTECSKMSCISFYRKTHFILQAQYENNKKAYRVLLKDENLLLRVETYSQVSPEQAKKFYEYKTMQLTNLYEDAESPYPGVISDQISCGQKFKPIFKQLKTKALNISYYSGYLNDRLQYGSCIEDQLRYKSKVAMFYCQPQKKWYQLEFITPFDKDTEEGLRAIESINCVNQ